MPTLAGVRACALASACLNLDSVQVRSKANIILMLKMSKERGEGICLGKINQNER